MIGETWTSYKLQPAPPSLLCQFRINFQAYCAAVANSRFCLRRWRDEGPPRIGYVKDFSGQFDTDDLEWKLTGIAKEQAMQEEDSR
jgi:hypothetical protein